MGKRLSVLVALVVAQLVVVGLVWWPGQGNAATGKALLSVTARAVTRITLVQQQKKGKPETLALVRQKSGWRLPGAHDFPADAGRVQELLTHLAALKTSLPVAVTPDAASRIDVARDHFSSRVTLQAGGAQRRLYVGNSAGANLVYVRRAGDKAIYSVDLPSSLLSAGRSSWENKQLLSVPVDHIERLALPKLTLVKHGKEWRLAHQATLLRQGKADALVDQLAGATFEAVAGREGKFSLPDGGFDVRLKTRGKTLTYHFSKAPGSKGEGKNAKPTWYLTRSGVPFVFKVNAALATSMQNARAKGLEAPPATKPSASKGTTAAK